MGKPNDQGFLRLRNGLLEHVEEGRFNLRLYALYIYLLQRRRWASGIVWTNARSIATTFGEKITTVQSLMQTLRVRGYIQYPKGFGKKGNYPVCIINDQPTHGMLTGYRLSGFSDETYTSVIYEPLNGEHTEIVLTTYGGWADDRLTMGSARVLIVPLLDIRSGRLLDCEDQTENSEGDAPPLEPQIKSVKAGV